MASKKESTIMATVFIGLLIAYLIYVFMLHPWERVAIYAKAGELIVNVYDCDTKYPISGAQVKFYTTEGELLKEGKTDTSGLISFKSLPRCIKLKASYSGDKYAGVCLGDGEKRTVDICFNAPAANPNVLYATDYVGIIGARSGDEISSKEFSQVALSYPVESAIAKYPDYYLFSNILWNERMNLELRVNKSITDAVALSFVIKSKKGNPVTVVRLQGIELFKDYVTPGDVVTVNAPKGLINETMKLSLSCKFTGLYFWSTQDCEITNITVKQDYYLPINPEKEYEFNTTSIERESDITSIEFVSEKSSKSGLKIYVNDNLIFNIDKLNATDYKGEANTKDLNLKGHGNKLKFELTPGSNASLGSVKLSFKMKNETYESSKELYFDAPSDVLENASYFEVHAYISEVLLGGSLFLKINNATYEKEIRKAGWITVKIDKEDVKGDNTLTLSARNAKFEIQKLRVSYV